MLARLLNDLIEVQRRTVTTGVDPIGQPIDTIETVSTLVHGRIVRKRLEDADRSGAEIRYLLYAVPDLSDMATGSVVNDGEYRYVTKTLVDRVRLPWGPLGEISVCHVAREEH